MPFVLPDLLFAKDALDPVMSAETLEFHHGKHHRGYVDKTNELVADDRALVGATLSKVIRTAKRDENMNLFNNAAQLWNHSFFWRCLAPADGRRPDGKLLKLIEDEFGSTETMIARLKGQAVAHFGSGWAWLVLDRGNLRIITLQDADTPVAHEGMAPLFTLDVWEHAYYIDYRNARPKFADEVLGKIVNWDFVAQNLDGRGADRADQDSEMAKATEPIV